MIQTVGEMKNMRQAVDPAALTEAEIRQGVTYNGQRWGSYGYYIAEEIDRCLRDRAGIRAYLDFDASNTPGRLRVYYRSASQRAADQERDDYHAKQRQPSA